MPSAGQRLSSACPSSWTVPGYDNTPEWAGTLQGWATWLEPPGAGRDPMGLDASGVSTERGVAAGATPAPTAELVPRPFASPPPVAWKGEI